MKPRVRIKYCGGCNPNYDRVALVKEMKARLSVTMEWVSSDADPFIEQMRLKRHGLMLGYTCHPKSRAC